MQRVQVIAINSGRLWREGLGKLLEGSEFALHPDPDRIAGNFDLLRAMETPAIMLYRQRGFADTGMDWVGRIRALAPSVKIAILTSDLKLAGFRRAMDAGVDGYLTDDISGRAFIRMLAMMLDGERVIPSSLADLVTGRAQNGKDSRTADNLVTLSDIESEILKRVAAGESNKQIANALGLSESTIKGRVKTLLRKLNATNRTQAAIWGLAHGLGYGDPLPSKAPEKKTAIGA